MLFWYFLAVLPWRWPYPSANMFLYVYRLLSVSSLINRGRPAIVKSDPASIMLTVQSGDAQWKRLPFFPAIVSLLGGILDADASQPLLTFLYLFQTHFILFLCLRTFLFLTYCQMMLINFVKQFLNLMSQIRQRITCYLQQAVLLLTTIIV